MTKTKTQVLPIDVESIAERVLANRGLWIPRTTADESAKDYLNMRLGSIRWEERLTWMAILQHTGVTV
jgi:hypothetical protein